MKNYSHEERNALCGVAIILVILYHFAYTHPCPFFKYFSIFNYGYIGVDIFLFFSAYGLCFSLNNNNSLKKFYMRRILRIVPLLFLYLSIRTVYYAHNHEDFSFWDFFCSITTLSYYRLGGVIFEWYLNALLLLYLLFPLLYRIGGIVKTQGLAAIIAILVLLSQFFNISWEFAQLIYRIPIFLLGIVTFHVHQAKEDKEILQACIALFTLIGFGLLTCNIPAPLHVTLIAPSLIISLLYLRAIRTKGIQMTGKYSLEIYLGNTIAMLLPRTSLGGGIYSIHP